MPFDPERCYKIVACHSERCIQRTEDFGVLQLDSMIETYTCQLWKLCQLEDGTYLVIACDSEWCLTHHGFYSGPISLSPRQSQTSRGQKWQIVKNDGQSGVFHLLTGRQVTSFKGIVDHSCLDVARLGRGHQHLLEWHFHGGSNQSFKILYRLL